jgi:TrpR-related protein YerC/YecD
VVSETNQHESSTDKDSDEILIDLFSALSNLHSEGEAKLFLSDLLTHKETRGLAKRLRIAVYLKAGYSYREIAEHLGAGRNTIARVATWLQINGQGYALVVNRLVEIGRLRIQAESNDDPITSLNGPYTEGFWPVEVLGSIFKELAKARKR